jgi:hypothetical protein
MRFVAHALVRAASRLISTPAQAATAIRFEAQREIIALPYSQGSGKSPRALCYNENKEGKA